MNSYELQRLENIKRNDQMLSALQIHSKLTDLYSTRLLSSPTKRVKRLKTEAPVVLRQSLRTRGVQPDPDTAKGIVDNLNVKVRKKSSSEQGPVQMRDAFVDQVGSGRNLVETISSCGDGKNEEFGVVYDFVDVKALQLKSENVVQLVTGMIMNVCFYPTLDMQMVVVGNKLGDLGFWNVNADKEEGDGIYVYRPHSAAISGIAIHPFSISKMYSSCYDGFIRLMDVEKEVFDMVYSSEYTIYSIALSPHDQKLLYCNEGKGGVNLFDVRAGKSSLLSRLHEDRINTLDISSTNNNLMATGCTDGTACIWDVRQLSASKPTPLNTVRHKRSVHSAYFSPTGKFLATTSTNNIGFSSGANYEDTSMVFHRYQANRWKSPFRGIWGWDDSSIFIGNLNRGVDIISTNGESKTVATLQSDLMSSNPCRFAAHPYSIGKLAGTTMGGTVYIWNLP